MHPDSASPTQNQQFTEKLTDTNCVQSCRLAAYDGPLDPDDDEVFSIEWMSLQQLKQHATSSEITYTPWLMVEMRRMHWLHDDTVLQGQSDAALHQIQST